MAPGKARASKAKKTASPVTKAKPREPKTKANKSPKKGRDMETEDPPRAGFVVMTRTRSPYETWPHENVHGHYATKEEANAAVRREYDEYSDTDMYTGVDCKLEQNGCGFLRSTVIDQESTEDVYWAMKDDGPWETVESVGNW